MEAAGPEGWIYCVDADHELVSLTPDIPPFQVVKQALTMEVCTAWAVPLWDLWQADGKGLRTDGYWQAPLHPRPWFFRAQPTPSYRPLWGDRAAIHCGHSPANFPLVIGLLPLAIAHWGYATEAHRKTKAEKYLALAPSAPTH